MAEFDGKRRPEYIPATSRPLTTSEESTRTEAESAGNPIARLGVYEKLSRIPKGEEPAFWPVRVLNELEYTANPYEFPDRPRTRQWAPFYESVQRVKRAYEVLAYPHVRYEAWRELIEDDLQFDQKYNKRDTIELTDQEAVILHKLARAGRVPIDPLQRTYDYHEVFHPTKPLAPLLNAAELIIWLAEQERAREAEENQR
jgi:hypothetical protein